MIIDQQKLGKVIRSIRGQLGLTQKALAQKVGMATSYLCLVENGKRRITLNGLDAIASEFNIPTYREKNAIFAYHFFRLLQRAKNIHIIYNTEPDPIAGGDKSEIYIRATGDVLRLIG